MLKPYALKKGDKVAIVSLSSGVLGEPFIKHELDLGIKRLDEFGLTPVFMPNALKGMDFIKNHPDKRTEDLKTAFKDPSIKGIITALGGIDTHLTVPYLLDDPELKEIIENNPKIFVGFSDTSINHLTLNKLGLCTYYGPSFIADICELDNEMLPYTKMWFEQLFNPTIKKIESSPVWYMERDNFGPEQLGIPRVSKEEKHGFEVIQGSGKVRGQFIGGCLDSIASLLTLRDSQPEKLDIQKKYDLFPTLEQLKDALFFIETSEEKMSPEDFKTMILAIKDTGAFNVINALLVGKPQDEAYFEEYKVVLKEALGNTAVPILYNLNYGHAVPRCIIPYGIMAEVDFDQKSITFLEKMVKYDNPELDVHLDKEGKLIRYPAKLKNKIVALEYLAEQFEFNREYTEKEINEVIDGWHSFNDAVWLRRELITYMFLSRTSDGRTYWLNKKTSDLEF